MTSLLSDLKGFGMTNRRMVQPHKGGKGWQVKKPGSDRASVVTDTKQEAIDRGRQILRNTGGGELTQTNRKGVIIDSDTVAPGNDPNPPRDKK